MATDSQTLYDQAKCYACLGITEFEALELALLAQIAANVGPVPVAPNVPTNINISDASVDGNTIVTWSNSDVPTTNEIWKSTDNVTFALFSSVAGTIHTFTDVAAMGNNVHFYYKVRACNGVACSVYTSVVSVSKNISGALAGATLNESTLILAYGNYAFDNSAALTSASFPLLRISFGFISAQTCNLLAAFTVPVLKNTGGIVLNRTALTAVSFPAMTDNTGFIDLTNNASLTSVTSNALVNLAGPYDISGNAAITVFQSNALAVVSGIFLDAINVPVISLPALTTCNGDFQCRSGGALTTLNIGAVQTVIGNLIFSDNTNLSSVNVANVQVIGNGGRFDFKNCPLLTTVTANNLTSIDTDFFGFGSGLTAVSFTSLGPVGGQVDFSSCAALVNSNMPALTIDEGNYISYDGDALNTASVDQVLSRGVASGTTVSSYLLANGTNSTPTGGVANPDYVTLTGLGNNVQIN